jgi:glycosyltransferase involved in cell wall biosynthesis
LSQAAPGDLRLGVDALRALRNSTGLGNHSRGVLRGLRAAAPELPLTLYSPRPPIAAHASLPAELGAPLRLPVGAWTTGPLASLWRTFRLGRAAARDGITLYHGLSHEIPRDIPGTGIPTVVTFHDLIYHRHPELFSRADRASYAWRYRASAERATAIVSVSAATRDDLIACYGVAPDRIAVIPPAVDPRFAIATSNEARAAVRTRHGLPAEYLLSLGTLEPRKNQALAIEAMGRLGPEVPSLVLVGRDGGSLAALRELASRRGVTDRVHFLTAVPDADLPAIVQGATLFLYPSWAEGFGMPIVEALLAGVPVIASDVACLREAGGGESRYVPHEDPERLADEITSLLGDEGSRDRLRAVGRAHAARFDGVTLAHRLLAVYDAVISGRPLPADLSHQAG